MKKVFAILIVILSVSLTSCDKNNWIYGKWDTIYLSSDDEAFHPYNGCLSFYFENNNKLTHVVSCNGGFFERTYEVKPDSIIIYTEDNHSVRYKILEQSKSELKLESRNKDVFGNDHIYRHILQKIN